MHWKRFSGHSISTGNCTLMLPIMHVSGNGMLHGNISKAFHTDLAVPLPLTMSLTTSSKFQIICYQWSIILENDQIFMSIFHALYIIMRMKILNTCWYVQIMKMASRYLNMISQRKLTNSLENTSNWNGYSLAKYWNLLYLNTKIMRSHYLKKEIALN